MKIASEQELHLDMSAVNPSALLVSAANGCCAGICAYNSDSFSAPAQHAGELYTLHKGMSFIFPPQTLHSFRRLGSEYLKVLWFHAAP